MHPLQRILLSLVVALLIFYFTHKSNFGIAFNATIIWDIFAFMFITICWIVFFTRSQSDIKRVSNIDDGSRFFVLVSILITTFASMFAVLLLITATKDQAKGNEVIALLIAVGGMISSWIMVHTLFAFHYAHMYYQGENKNEELDFPGNASPDYIDFAYFSFIIGMTFQVSDVSIPSRRMRRTVLAHSLLAFALNTFVVALTINLIAGLRN